MHRVFGSLLCNESFFRGLEAAKAKTVHGQVLHLERLTTTMAKQNQNQALTSPSLLAESSAAPPHLVPYQRVKMKSASIPIQNQMKRTESELKLCVDEEMADIRDYLFFARLVNGIARHQATESTWLQREKDECLEHILMTRSGCRDRNCPNPACVSHHATNSNDTPPTLWCGDQVCLQANQWINESDDVIFEMDM